MDKIKADLKRILDKLDGQQPTYGYLLLLPTDLRHIINNYLKYEFIDLYHEIGNVKGMIRDRIIEPFCQIWIDNSIVYFESEAFAKYFLNKYDGFFGKYNKTNITQTIDIPKNYMYEVLEYRYSIVEWSLYKQFVAYRNAKIDSEKQ